MKRIKLLTVSLLTALNICCFPAYAKDNKCLGMTVRDEQIEGIVDIISGVYIENIDQRTPISSGSLSEGDLITGINGHRVTCVKDLTEYLKTVKPGSTVTVEITWVNLKGYYKTTTYLWQCH